MALGDSRHRCGIQVTLSSVPSTGGSSGAEKRSRRAIQARTDSPVDGGAARGGDAVREAGGSARRGGIAAAEGGAAGPNRFRLAAAEVRVVLFSPGADYALASSYSTREASSGISAEFAVGMQCSEHQKFISVFFSPANSLRANWWNSLSSTSPLSKSTWPPCVRTARSRDRRRKVRI